jgi:hypothetical protein
MEVAAALKVLKGLTLFWRRPLVQITYRAGPKASRSGSSKNQIECEWKGVLLLYNGSPHDASGLSLELAPNCLQLPLEELKDSHLNSGGRIKLRLDVKREYPREIVKAAGHKRFVQLIPTELARFQCRASYKNAAGLGFYSLYRRSFDKERCSFRFLKPRWADS